MFASFTRIIIPKQHMLPKRAVEQFTLFSTLKMIFLKKPFCLSSVIELSDLDSSICNSGSVDVLRQISSNS